jgi:hypothetical protein
LRGHALVDILQRADALCGAGYVDVADTEVRKRADDRVDCGRRTDRGRLADPFRAERIEWARVSVLYVS